MRKFISLAAGVLLCLAFSNVVQAQGRGKGGEKENDRSKPGAKSESGRSGGNGQGNPGGKPVARKPSGNAPGGNWSEAKPPAGNQQQHAEGVAAINHNSPKSTSGADGMAAGAAAANRNNPKATRGEDAAAGAAVANRNSPQASGAEGAAAGAAAANRNAPKASGADSAAAGAALAERNQPRMSGAAGATAGYDEVRSSFNRHDLYGADWYGSHAGAWTAAGWSANAAWTCPPWSGLAKHFGYGDNPPVSYSYGSNVTCVDGNVLLDGENIGTAEEFSQQAADLAQAGADSQTTAEDKWVPLGVFAMVRNEQQHPQLILQLAMNQQGNLRGNYTDETTDNTLPIQGGIDTKTQRAAWGACQGLRGLLTFEKRQ